MIRLAKESDAERLSGISLESVCPAWRKEDFSTAIENPQAKVFVFGEQPVGYGVFYFAADEGEVSSIAVSKDARRQGIGNEILGAMERFAKEQGILRIFLEVRQSNKGAISFYQNKGFCTVGRRPNFYTNPTEDGWIMEKNLLERME